MKAAEQQAEADGSPVEDPECPQLSLSVRQIINISDVLSRTGGYNECNIISPLETIRIIFLHIINVDYSVLCST